MSKSKKKSVGQASVRYRTANKVTNKPGHVYTDEQTRWILDNAKLQRTALAKGFNKQFRTRLSPLPMTSLFNFCFTKK